jgi:hypothetical protein
MSLLQVQKKAETDGEIEALIQETLRLQSPFGVPTLFLTESDFYNVNFASPDAHKKIRKQIRKKIADADDEFRMAYYVIRDNYGAELTLSLNKLNLSQSVYTTFSSNSTARGLCQTVPSSVRFFHGFAHEYPPEIFNDPLLSFIIMPLKSKEQDPMSAYKNHLDFSVLWHEIGHTIQAGEPHADMISVIMTRRHLKPSFIAAYRADYRALTSFAGTTNEFYLKNINWHVIDAMDYTAKLPQKTIDTINADQIKSLRLLKYRPTYEPFMQSCTSMLKKMNGSPWLQSFHDDCNQLVDASEHFLKKWADRKGTPEYAIVQRFNLAATRLSIGADAYKDDRLEQKMWEDGYKFHFMPEALPEFLPPP